MKEKIIEIDNGSKLAIGVHDDGDGYALELKDSFFINNSWVEIPASINLNSDNLFQIMEACARELKKNTHPCEFFCFLRDINGLPEACAVSCESCNYVKHIPSNEK